jgi:hypothetical protein
MRLIAEESATGTIELLDSADPRLGARPRKVVWGDGVHRSAAGPDLIYPVLLHRMTTRSTRGSGRRLPGRLLMVGAIVAIGVSGVGLLPQQLGGRFHHPPWF